MVLNLITNYYTQKHGPHLYCRPALIIYTTAAYTIDQHDSRTLTVYWNYAKCA